MDLYLYLVDDGVRNIDDERVLELGRRGAKLFACAPTAASGGACPSPTRRRTADWSSSPISSTEPSASSRSTDPPADRPTTPMTTETERPRPRRRVGRPRDVSPRERGRAHRPRHPRGRERRDDRAPGRRARRSSTPTSRTTWTGRISCGTWARSRSSARPSTSSGAPCGPDHGWNPLGLELVPIDRAELAAPPRRKPPGARLLDDRAAHPAPGQGSGELDRARCDPRPGEPIRARGSRSC